MEAVIPIHSVWNRRLRRSGGGPIAVPAAACPAIVPVPVPVCTVTVPVPACSACAATVAVVSIASPENLHLYAIIHSYVNDGTIVSMWQDVSMEQFSVEAEPPAVRNVNDVEVLKALADPTRLAIVSALMKSGGDLPVMSVKELAAELGEPQTKLYRHVRQLEAVGLIRVAGTRMVSGILEQRYQACQRDLTLDRGFLREHADESEQAMQAVLDLYREGFFAAFRADRLPTGEAEEDYRRPLMFMLRPEAFARQGRGVAQQAPGDHGQPDGTTRPRTRTA